MKKFTLILSLLATTLCASAAATSVILDGDFDGITELPICTQAQAKQLAAGKWGALIANTSTATITVEDVEGRGNVVNYNQITGTSWWLVNLFQNISNIKAETYELSFEAKSTQGSAISVFAYVGADEKLFATKEGFDKDKTPGQSAARTDYTLTTDWVSYSFQISFATLCNNINAANSAGFAMSEATAEQLSHVRLCFSTKGSQGSFLIDNISLTPVNGDDVVEEPVYNPEADIEHSDRNVITNGTFAGTDLEVETVTNANNAAADIWYALAPATDNLSVSVARTRGVDNGNAIDFYEAINKGVTSWYSAYLFQNLNDKINPDIYTLTFDARYVDTPTTLSFFAYVVGSGTLYASKPEFNKETQRTESAARFDAKLTPEWTTYTIPVDFNTLCNTVTSPSGATTFALSEATEQQLKKVRVCFNTNNTAGNFLIDNVSLVQQWKYQTSVADVAIDGAEMPVEYYNLQGVPVANPANGIYIRRQGSRITKVAF